MDVSHTKFGGHKNCFKIKSNTNRLVKIGSYNSQGASMLLTFVKCEKNIHGKMLVLKCSIQLICSCSKTTTTVVASVL